MLRPTRRRQRPAYEPATWASTSSARRVRKAAFMRLALVLTRPQQRLVAELYPAAVAAGERPSRHPEFVALALLYFACAGGTPDEVAAALRSTPEHLLQAPQVACALSALSALALRDGPAFCRIATGGDVTPLMRLLMARRLPAARTVALSAIARSFRSLPMPAAARMLRVADDAAVVALLEQAAPAPGAPPALAHALLHIKGTPSGGELVFAAA